MKFLGIVLILFGLPLLFIPIIGVPMIIIGFIMIMSSIGSSNANKTAKAIAQHMQQAPAADDPAPQGGSTADELGKLGKLLSDGLLTQDEFDRKKAQLLGL